MVAGRPYYPRYAADFIMAVRGWDLADVGAYSLIIDHLNDRDRPLPDDDRFMAGLLHCSPQRWRKIRAYLIDHGKMIATPDGYLTNPRFERDRARARGESEIAQAYGRAGGLERARRAGQLDMDLDAGWEGDDPAPRAHTHGGPKDSRKSAAKSRETSGRTSQTYSRDRKQKTSEINGRVQPPPQAPRAGASRASPESRDSTHSQPRVSDPRGGGPGPPIGDLDLAALTQLICDAAGLIPATPEALDRATRQVDEWKRQGVDFEAVVLPSVRHLMATKPERTRTLGRFKVLVAHNHARHRASQLTSATYRPPDVPLLDPDDEDPVFQPLRSALLEGMGAVVFCFTVNRVRFRDWRAENPQRKPLKIEGEEHPVSQLRHGEHAGLVRKIAKAHGFKEVW